MSDDVVKHAYTPNPSQIVFHSSPAHIKGFMGAKGSGKTRTLIEETVALCYEFPGNVFVVARKDYPALERTTMQYFLDWLPPELKLHFNNVKRKLTIRSKDPEKPSIVYFVQEKEPKEFESLELGGFAIDEADECPYETYKILRSRLRLKNVARYSLLAFNPTNRLHWLYDTFVTKPAQDKELAKDVLLARNNTYENMANLPSDYIDELKRTYTGDELKRYLFGEWGSVSNEWSVWQNYRSGLHVARELIEPVVGLPIIRAWDFGMRAACLCGQLLGKQLRFLRPEIMEFNKGAEQFVPLVLSKQSQVFHGYRFFDLSDPTFVGNRSIVDSRKSCKSVLADHGVRIVGGTMQWDKRYSAVDWFLTTLDSGQPALQIDPACDYLVGGFEGGYRFRENANERRAEDVMKNEYSEVHDCAQHIAVHARKMLKSNYDFDNYSYPVKEERYSFGLHNARR